MKLRFNTFPKNKANIGFSLDKFKIISEIGQGAYGTIYRVVSLIDDNDYTMKILDLLKMDEVTRKKSFIEVEILKKIKHRHVVKYYSSFFEDNKLYIILEYCSGGDLFRV